MSLRDLLIINLTLQAFDGLFSYQAFSLLGAHEANPFVGAAISSWGVIYGLLYKKTFACVSAGMEDRTGTFMCSACADDAMDSGAFR
jgi:hypothetical protein